MGKKGQAEIIDQFLSWLEENCCSCISSATATAAASAVLHNPRAFLKILKRRDFTSLINYYQKEIDPQMKRRLHAKRICRYYPTCSEYTKEAIRQYGSFLGMVKGAFRILRCNPLSKGGYDPVR